MSIPVTDVRKALRGADYPATSEELADTAAANGADEDLVDLLGELGDDTFESTAEVLRALDEDLDEAEDEE